MEKELARLEEQLEQLITLYEKSRADARELRVRIAAAELENRSLSARVSAASERIEVVLAKLADDGDDQSEKGGAE